MKTVLVLGGTAPHAELIKYLGRKGYRTVLVDYLEHPVALPFANLHVRESTLVPEAVERVARQERVDYIMDICTDRALPVAAYVSNKLGLPFPFDLETVLVATDKPSMKDFMVRNGIRTSRFVPVTVESDISRLDLRYPLMVKPSDASGSIGITKVESPASLGPAVSLALEKSRNGIAIVEEFVSGEEIQIDCFVLSGQVNILDIKRKRKHLHNLFTLPFGSVVPAGISERNREEIDKLCVSLAHSLGIKDGPLYIQAIASPTGVSVIEFGLRFGGGLSYRMIKDLSGVDIVDATCDAYLGEHPVIHNQFPNFSGAYASFHIFPKAGTFSRVSGYEPLQEAGVFHFFSVKMKPGTQCTGDMSSKERVAAFILKSSSEQENRDKLRLVLEKLDVLDNKGQSMMRKDIYCE